MNLMELIHTLTTTITTLAGLGVVVYLSGQGVITDGETISALSAVLGIQVGLHAVKVQGGAEK